MNAGKKYTLTANDPQQRIAALEADNAKLRAEKDLWEERCRQLIASHSEGSQKRRLRLLRLRRLRRPNP